MDDGHEVVEDISMLLCTAIIDRLHGECVDRPDNLCKVWDERTANVADP